MACEWGSGFPLEVAQHICGANCSGIAKPVVLKKNKDIDGSHLADCHAVGMSTDPMVTMASILSVYDNPCSPAVANS